MYNCREYYLLIDPEISTIDEIQLGTQAISHELTHQWFGNIVTPTWWSDLWLNEGFAVYFEYFATGEVVYFEYSCRQILKFFHLRS